MSLSEHAALVLVGADTFAGEAALNLLADIPSVEKVTALSASPADDATVEFSGDSVQIESLADFRFQAGQLVLCVGNALLAEQAIQMAGDAGALVIDATSFTRSQQYAELVHPRINSEALMSLSQNGVVAVPGDVGMVVAPVVRALRQLGGVARVDLNCSLSVSGAADERGVSELASQTNRLLNGLPAEHEVFQDQVAFNLLPGFFHQQGDAQTAAREIVELAGHEGLPVHVSSIVAPVFYGQIIRMSVTLEWPVSEGEVMDVLESVPGLVIIQDQEEFLTPVALVSRDDEERQQVFLGGLATSDVQDNVLNMWIVSDNARSGAVYGAVKLYQQLISEFLQ
ncbi:Asd/ArgC dimerization domain-containing protein [Parendozoicomonas haliclonae]|uniref:Aspartate-semialdehyde dehydrogenase 2 n=1 Tax=Parendozoicomonas haliclonae TaxID=1960125 RepID=A0A1X7AML6_9GAMM|nr:Asd/ArgC dimerization domain-containing protein [Parendozoicomonas haliclonae]SMA47463.1 Aspartate-semialdehyde dehydrogenase 2 [Parendozoicomonas haliclonae]